MRSAALLQWRSRSAWLVLALLVVTALARLIRIDYPAAYSYDEVYHVYTAAQLVEGNRDIWDVYAHAPQPGVAYEWTHPPLAKEIMAAGMLVFGTTDWWAARVPGAITGTVAVLLACLLGLKLFSSRRAALLAAAVLSIDGLLFVQSRTGMNDIYVVTFMLAGLLLLLHRRYAWAAVLLGLAFASKWTAVYAAVPVLVVLAHQTWQDAQAAAPVPQGGHPSAPPRAGAAPLLPIVVRWFAVRLLPFVLIPPVVYGASYLPMFLMGYSFNDLVELQKQMWYYHTHLVATHEFASKWYEWPLNLRPVWYYVAYPEEGMIASIFASGNPPVFWAGLVAVVVSGWEAVRKLGSRKARDRGNGGTEEQRNGEDGERLVAVGAAVGRPRRTGRRARRQGRRAVQRERAGLGPWLEQAMGVAATGPGWVVLCYCCMLLPWVVSPRIMFEYHYAPAVPFLCLALGYQLDRLGALGRWGRWAMGGLLVVMLAGFIAMYPYLTGVPLPKDVAQWFYYTNLDKNPFTS